MSDDYAAGLRRRATWMGVFITGLLVMNVALIYQNRALVSAEADHITARDVLPGDVIPPILSGVSVLDGAYASVDLRSSGGNTLLVYVSGRCQACVDSMDRLRGLAHRASDDWQVVWLSIEPLADARTFLARHGIREQLMLADVPWGLYLRLGLRHVPTVVLVGRDGVVEQVWHGRVDEERLDEMSAHVVVPPRSTR